MITNQNQAHLTAANSSWLADSGCNAHETADLKHFTTASDYSGDDQIGVGSGQSLPISHTGCGILQTSSNLNLSNLLRVPHISSNLLSVHRLCVDNNCIIIFDSSSFHIQDKYSGKTLYQGPSVNGLYPIHATAPSNSASSHSPLPPTNYVAHTGTQVSFSICTIA